MFKKSALFTTVLSLSAGLISCTKDIQYKYQFKEEVLEKSLVDTSNDYIYSTSMQNASRTSSDALPFSTGDNKRVHLQWTKDALRIVEKERDHRFAGNSTNDKLVLEIPVEHIDFRCSKDKYGECTNSEESVSDVDWSQKGKFKMKAGSAKSGDLDLLPIMISQTLGENCYKEVSSRVLGYELTDSSLNFQIERTFQTSLECLGNDAGLSDVPVSAVYHYSMVKASSILSKGFKPVLYPTKDEGTFGFFSTKMHNLDVDNNKMQNGEVVIMNHWNPDRTSLDYYLSDEFNKKENAKIKALTVKTVNNINAGLRESGVKFQINLKEPAGKIPGDIRNSMIVLVEDPVASSVIGYGPQTEDPMTGEIISARTVMFLGTIKKFIKFTYDEIVREKRTIAKGLNKAKVTVSEEAGGKFTLSGVQNSSTSKSSNSAGRASLNSISAAQASLKQTKKIDFGSQNKVEMIKKDITNYKKSVNTLYNSDNKMAQLRYQMEVKNCALGAGADIVSAGLSQKLLDQFSADAKLWEDLSDSEKQAVIDIILPEIWVPTLIHEMGHNLGLRHNFQASEDKDNYFSSDELASRNIDHMMPFSSVMDYGNDLKTLPILGKYDIAALKFGYLRKVENTKGELITIQNTLEEMEQKGLAADLKEYGFCTDEHVGINAGCRRFDEGSSYTEIVQNMIKTYEENYASRNFRHGKESFSAFDDVTYAGRINSTFKDMRLMMEVVERIKGKYHLEDNDSIWTENAFLKDLRTAALLAGQFLNNVLLVPDTTCAVAKVTSPTEIVALVRLNQVDNEAISCFDLKLSTQYVVIGQTGKLMNNKKDPKSNNPYADQIDVRGTWIDKVIAANTLFRREIGVSNLDKLTDNFTDMAELKPLLSATLKGLLTNTAVISSEFKTKTGETFSLDFKPDLFAGSMVEKLIAPSISKALGVPHRNFYLNEKISSVVSTTMTSDLEHQESGLEIQRMVQVIKTDATKGITSDYVKALPSVNSATTKFYADSTNTLALELIGKINLITTLSTLERKVLVDIYIARTKNNTMPADVTDAALKLAWTVAMDDLFAYLSDDLDTKEDYMKMIDFLAAQ